MKRCLFREPLLPLLTRHFSIATASASRRSSRRGILAISFSPNANAEALPRRPRGFPPTIGNDYRRPAHTHRFHQANRRNAEAARAKHKLACVAHRDEPPRVLAMFHARHLSVQRTVEVRRGIVEESAGMLHISEPPAHRRCRCGADERKEIRKIGRRRREPGKLILQLRHVESGACAAGLPPLLQRRVDAGQEWNHEKLEQKIKHFSR